ncbi:Thiosulfate sulfurtransferase rdl2, mitochondrial [Coemansia spiralis]|nr:Thiosulfate sulfurtransferase rdl2, mitochondrial [Coemansia spiralis]
MPTQIALDDILAISRADKYGDRPAVIIDVRGKDEYAAGHVKGAHNVPVQELQTALALAPDAFKAAYGFVLPAVGAGTALAVHCMSGKRTLAAAKHLDPYGDDLLLYLPGWAAISASPSAVGQTEQS